VDNGRHIDTPGLVYPANLHAQLLGCTGSSLLSFALTAGAPNAYTAALSGDWNGDGISTLAFFVNNATVSGYVYSDTNGPGTTSTFQWFGGPNTSYRPVAGRWSAGSNPEMGLYNTTTGQFLLGRDPANNNARISFTQTHVPLDAKPVAGDWTGKGYDTVGLFSSGNFYLFDSHADAVPNEFAFGKADAQDHAIAGDWDGDGKDSIGLISAESGCASGWKVFLRNSNSNGFADRAYCVPTSTEAGAFSAVAGRWQ
jgi:hypothetical protein